ncbi:MAG TPA: PhnD/SsuA/transferrin family substrate-binding protein [Methylomirabilota bacterium]|jgi:phosphonate transport system substrate-binding protein|nr:PhnD/SsuA/transferrin family substrate-binding protein [Methylomirabilota bacterium]
MLTLASFLAENARPIYERMAHYVSQRLGESAELLVGLAWEERHRRLDAGLIQVAFICGLPYTEKFDRPDRPVELLCAPVMAHPRYDGRPVYFTDVIVRADSPLKSFADLRGRSYAYNDPASNSGYVMPRHHLLGLGETAGYFGRTVASGGHQKSIQLVREGAVDASGIDSTVLELETKRDPRVASELRVVESIGPCPIPPVVVSSRLGDDVKARLREVFLTMAEDPDGRVILADGLLARFVPVRDRDYDPIRAMVRRATTAGFLILR